MLTDQHPGGRPCAEHNWQRKPPRLLRLPARSKPPRSENDLTGEVAAVTGASRGLGLLLAKELGAKGAGW